MGLAGLCWDDATSSRLLGLDGIINILRKQVRFGATTYHTTTTIIIVDNPSCGAVLVQFVLDFESRKKGS